jgi:methionine aminotransferase
LGLEVRHYSLLRENAYRAELNAIRALTDARTKLVPVNSPHNPTGATFSDAEMQSLHDFLAGRGIQFVVDEVITRFIMDRRRPPQRGFLMPRW